MDVPTSTPEGQHCFSGCVILTCEAPLTGLLRLFAPGGPPVPRLESLHLIGKSSLNVHTMKGPEEGLKCRGTRRAPSGCIVEKDSGQGQKYGSRYEDKSRKTSCIDNHLYL